MSDISLLGFELLGKLILEELQLIRKDMKNEIQKIGVEIQKLYGLHHNLLTKFDEKLNNVLKQSERAKEIRHLDKPTVDIDTPNEDQASEVHCESQHDVMVIIDDDNSNSETTIKVNFIGSCSDKAQLKNREITVKEEISSFEEPEAVNYFENFKSENMENDNLVFGFMQKNNEDVNFNMQLNNSKSSTQSKYLTCANEATSNAPSSSSYHEEGKSKSSSSSNDVESQAQSQAFATSDSSLLADVEKNLNFRCQFCRKPFLHFSRFQSHLRTHTGEKPFRCSLCNKQFTQKGNLSKHMMLHKNEKPFSCQICNKNFSQKGHLKSHILRHSRHEWFNCDVCGKSFKHFSHLNAHKHVHDLLSI